MGFCQFYISGLNFEFEIYHIIFKSSCGGCRVKDMYGHVSERSGLKAPLIADDVYEIIMKVRNPFWHSVDALPLKHTDVHICACCTKHKPIEKIQLIAGFHIIFLACIPVFSSGIIDVMFVSECCSSGQ